jgi:gamma-glutamylcyclotransferase (GGCT)/AIG2-like uncharacterized protein YtfP
MAASIDLFVYGTLMREDCLASLTGRRFPRRKAELSGFERIVPPSGYPYITPKAGARVQGFLLLGVDFTSLAVLDNYEEEGHLYHRRRVEVTAGSLRIPCEVYVGDVEALKARFGAGSENGQPTDGRSTSS